MENTLENKAKLFAQYWGQDVQRFGNNDYIKTVNGFIEDSLLGGDYLLLTPLHLISDEDAVAVANILLRDFGLPPPDDFNFALHGRLYVNNEDKRYYKDAVIEVNDYLRSKGYALPYNGLSVEEQVQRGWVVLKTKI